MKVVKLGEGNLAHEPSISGTILLRFFAALRVCPDTKFNESYVEEQEGKIKTGSVMSSCLLQSVNDFIIKCDVDRSS